MQKSFFHEPLNVKVKLLYTRGCWQCSLLRSRPQKFGPAIEVEVNHHIGGGIVNVCKNENEPNLFFIQCEEMLEWSDMQKLVVFILGELEAFDPAWYEGKMVIGGKLNVCLEPKRYH